MTTLTGQCLCKNISYKAEGEISIQGNCHCADCRQSSGSLFATILFMNTNDVQISGETKSFSHDVDSGNVLTKMFCPNCGSQMFSSSSARPETIGIKAGSVNEHEHVKPQFNVYTGSKLNCSILDEKIPAFDKMPEG